jgi:predicted AlkP superfamily pyrophosphatase or phosphodiesterase
MLPLRHNFGFMKTWKLVGLLLLINTSVMAQTTTSAPNLVVGVVVDQMRWDFLYRYKDRYTADGFRRLLREGFSCENTFIPYLPTYTAPGHTTVYTGSVPSLHGILGNSWYSKAKKRNIYCTEDDSVRTVGSSSAAGKMSPKNMLATTITDELRIATNFRNKTIGIALKDRGAILPAGHTANAAYWFDNSSGGWISSTFYMNELPGWVAKLNAKKLPDQYLKTDWKTLYPINTYIQSTADATSYESKLPGEDAMFDHEVSKIEKNKYESFRYTPLANTYTIEMAKAAIEGEQLGKRGVTDFLTVSFSPTDYAGHAFGPNSVEVEDMYLRLDRELGAFLKYLDNTIGKGAYLLFLTADHGVANVPGFMHEHKIPAGEAADASVRKSLNTAIQQQFGVPALVTSVLNYQVFLDDSLLLQHKLDKKAVKELVIATLLKHPGIDKAVDLEEVGSSPLPETVKKVIINGYNQRLSGDVQFVFKPQWFDGWNSGTSHGAWNPYDAHIPLVWFGWNIKPGKLFREVYMTDIAPTLASLLRIQQPNATVGQAIPEVVR